MSPILETVDNYVVVLSKNQVIVDAQTIVWDPPYFFTELEILPTSLVPHLDVAGAAARAGEGWNGLGDTWVHDEYLVST